MRNMQHQSRNILPNMPKKWCNSCFISLNSDHINHNLYVYDQLLGFIKRPLTEGNCTKISIFFSKKGNITSIAQSIQMGFFPVKGFRYAFAFDLLNLYQQLLLHSFVSVKSFYTVLKNLQPGVHLPTKFESVR